MIIYLIRHGIAVERQPSGLLTDRARPLTAKGIKRMGQIAQRLRKLGVSPGEIWSSPLVRARQTAEILATCWSETAAIEIVDSLEPGGVMDETLSRLKSAQSRLGEVALVGHQPDLGLLASRLLGAPRGVGFTLRKGGVLCIKIADLNPPLAGEMRWLATPRLLRLSKHR